MWRKDAGTVDRKEAVFFLAYRALGTRRGTRAYPAEGAEPVIPAATKARGKATLFGKGKNCPGGMLVVKMLLGGRLSFLPALHLSSVRWVSHCWKGRCGTGSHPAFFFVLSSWEISRFLEQKWGNQYWPHEEEAEYVAEARCGLEQAWRQTMLASRSPAPSLSSRTATLSYARWTLDFTTLPKLITGSFDTLKALHWHEEAFGQWQHGC